MAQIRGTAGYNLGNPQFGGNSGGFNASPSYGGNSAPAYGGQGMSMGGGMGGMRQEATDPSPLEAIRAQTSKIEDFLDTLSEPVKP